MKKWTLIVGDNPVLLQTRLSCFRNGRLWQQAQEMPEKQFKRGLMTR
jgi:hypothetical protein